jgi:ABC-type transport system involved in multi-copper enzyme maturation permease subunit
MPLRRIAIGLLGLGCVVILGSTWITYAGLPVPSGTTPYSALGLAWSLRDLALFAGMWSFFGFVFGGWKVVLVAIGRPSGRTTATLIWFVLFAVFCGGLATETIHQFGLHLWY